MGGSVMLGKACDKDAAERGQPGGLGQHCRVQGPASSGRSHWLREGPGRPDVGVRQPCWAPGTRGSKGGRGGWGRLHPSSRGWCPQMRRPFRGAPSGLPPEGVTGNALGRSEDSGQRPCGFCRMKVGFAEPIMSKAERKGKQKITLRKCTLWRSQRRFLLASPISEYKLRSIHATFLSWVVLK